MKEYPRGSPFNDCNLSAIKQSSRIRQDLKNELMTGDDKKPSFFHDTTLLRPVSIRKNILHPPPEVQKKILNRPPIISDDDMLSILGVIRNTGSVFEKTPGVFNIHSIEELRNIITSNLNINFSGRTSTELFQNRGKTRFYLKAEDRDVLIGKCAVWKYQEGIGCIVNSVLRSSANPHCKAVLLIFNKTERTFRNVVIRVRNILLRHPCLMSMEETPDGNEWRMTMRGIDDGALQIRVHTLLYNIYKQTDNKYEYLNELERAFFIQG
ncbi:hypothetical protein [Maridesulfovibrio sp. FT414]|uniref:hypothetical protein n=1 Tax=Maridesulfovibrio sp. FT414 TaxID=2979469 RepID=UPI003D8022B0